MLRVYTMAAGLGVLVSAALGGACLPSARYTCGDDVDCARGESGRCEADGYCSYADDECGSGRVYSSLADPALAGACVDTEPAASTSSGSSGGDTGSVGSTTDVTPAGSSDSSTGSLPADWWDCSYAWRRPVTLSNPSDEALEHFTVSVSLDAETLAEVADDFADLRFVDGSDAEMVREIESFGESASAWLRVPRLEIGDAGSVWLYYGSPGAPAPAGQGSAFDDDYVGVWHLADDRGSSASGHALSLNGVDGVAGIAGGAFSFDEEGTDNLVAGDPEALRDVFAAGGTVSAFVAPQALAADGEYRIASKTFTDFGHAGWSFELDGADDPGLPERTVAFVRVGSGNTQRWLAASDAVVADGTWQHVAMTFDDTTLDDPVFYIDGQASVTDGGGGIGTPTSDVDRDFRIGRGPQTEGFVGSIDEVRVSRVIRSPAWISAEAASVRGEMASVGAAEASPCEDGA